MISAALPSARQLIDEPNFRWQQYETASVSCSANLASTRIDEWTPFATQPRGPLGPIAFGSKILGISCDQGIGL